MSLALIAFWVKCTSRTSLRPVDIYVIEATYHYPYFVTCPGQPLSDEQLVAEIGTFLMGGLETTAHSLSFTLYCIASNPAVQQKIVQELIEYNLIGENPSALTYEHLAHMNYLNAVLKESMRLYPAVAGFPRRVHAVTQFMLKQSLCNDVRTEVCFIHCNPLNCLYSRPH